MLLARPAAFAQQIEAPLMAFPAFSNTDMTGSATYPIALDVPPGMAEPTLPDLAILDIKMPRMDGLELLRRLRQAQDLPVIFLTSKEGFWAERTFNVLNELLNVRDSIGNNRSFAPSANRITALPANTDYQPPGTTGH